MSAALSLSTSLSDDTGPQYFEHSAIIITVITVHCYQSFVGRATAPPSDVYNRKPRLQTNLDAIRLPYTTKASYYYYYYYKNFLL